MPEGDPRQVTVVTDVLAGPGSLGDDRSWELAGNLISRSSPGFVGPNQYDYRLKKGSGTVDAGVALPRRLTPRFHYVEAADRASRPGDGRPDIGAYEHWNSPPRFSSAVMPRPE